MPRRAPRTSSAAVSWLYQSPQWNLYEVLLSLAWDDENEIPAMLVARQSPRSGKIAAASFLVDLRCLGVRSAFVRICKDPADYERRLREPLLADQYMQPADLNLVARIIQVGKEYAAGLGFAPDPEYEQASLLLAGAHPEACPVPVVAGGKDGRPLYNARPNDRVAQVLATLTRAVGAEGFRYAPARGNSTAD